MSSGRRDVARRRRSALARISPGALLAGIIAARAHVAGAERSAVSDLTARASAEAAVYTDDTHVDVFTPTIGITVESPLGGWSAGARYLVDVVTAASPDIVASASPPWREVRYAGSIDGRLQSGDLGVGAQASLSVEPDYRSVSVGAQGTLDLADKNYTLTLGYAYRHDAAGRTGTPFDVFQRTLQQHALSGGLTVVLSPAAIAGLQLDAFLEQGNQAKPYRYVPLFDPGTAGGIPSGAGVPLVSALRLHARPEEALPLRRERFALSGRLAWRARAATLRLEQRFYLDTWALHASTTDLRYMFDVGRRVTLWPHLRLHLQGGAFFWRRAYSGTRVASGAVLPPALRTGDRELGPLRTLTGGGGMSVQLTPRWTASLQVDGVFTHYPDTLYLTDRRGMLSALTLQALLD